MSGVLITVKTKIMSKENSSSSGISTIGLLGVVFVVLKLTEVIDWSWWWVTFPFWGGVIIAILVVLVVFLTTLIPSLKKRNKLNKKLETIKSKPRSKFAERLEQAQQKQLNKK